MASVTDTRRQNLRQLIDQSGGVSKLAKRMGYANPSFLSQMAGPNPSREITEKSARKLEKHLGLPAGALDTPLQQPAPPTLANDTAAMVAAVIRMVGTACEAEQVSLGTAKFADVVALVYQEAADRGAQPQEDRVRQLARLLK